MKRLTLTLLAAAGLLAGPPVHPVVAPSVTSARLCGGVVVVGFDTIQLHGRRWVPRPDDGRTGLELFDGTTWKTPAGVKSGGEHALRWAGTTRYQQARVITAGFRSVPRPIESGCA